jgi:hypothetical protein
MLAAGIEAAAVQDLFSLLGEAPPPDPRLESTAKRLLHNHLARMTVGDAEPTAAIPSRDANVSCLGTLQELQNGAVHAWGHFIATPRAHAEAFATFTASDGVPRVYMATAWRA